MFIKSYWIIRFCFVSIYLVLEKILHLSSDYEEIKENQRKSNVKNQHCLECIWSIVLFYVLY